MSIETPEALDVIAAILLIAGSGLSLIAGLGLLRFPDVLTRLHAATKPQVLGLFLALAGLGFALRSWLMVPVLLAAWGLMLITAPVSAHLVGQATYRSKHLQPERLYVDELSDVVGGGSEDAEDSGSADSEDSDPEGTKPTQN